MSEDYNVKRLDGRGLALPRGRHYAAAPAHSVLPSADFRAASDTFTLRGRILDSITLQRLRAHAWPAVVVGGDCAALKPGVCNCVDHDAGEPHAPPGHMSPLSSREDLRALCGSRLEVRRLEHRWLCFGDERRHVLAREKERPDANFNGLCSRRQCIASRPRT